MNFDITHEVVAELEAQVLRGEFNHISEDALTERLSDSDQFWKVLLYIIKNYHVDRQKADLALPALMFPGSRLNHIKTSGIATGNHPEVRHE